MELYVEIFFSKIIGGKIAYSKKLTRITHEDANPDKLVYDTLNQTFPHLIASPNDLLIHSTSWRFEQPGKMIVTYLVYSEELSFASHETGLLPLESLQVKGNDDPKVPRPLVLEEHHIVSHAFRHLSFLVKNDPVIRQVLSGNCTTLQAFEDISHALSGLVAL
jgi:hypothetical protein